MREGRWLVAALRRPLPWLAALVSVLLAVAAYQLPFNYSLPLAEGNSARFITNFYPPQFVEGRAARWSHAYSYIVLPGVGGNRALRITLETNPSRRGVANPKAPTVTALVGGEEIYRKTLDPASGWQTVTLDIDASHERALAARDLVIELRTDVYRPPDYQGNELGILVSGLKVEPLPGAGWQPVVPNVRTIALDALLVLVSYLLLGRLWAGRRAQRPAPRWVGWGAMAAGLALALWLVFDLPGFASVGESVALYAAAAYPALLIVLYLLPAVVPVLAAEWGVVRVAVNWRPLFAALIAAPVLFSFGFQQPAGYTIDIGSGRDAPFIHGFNPPMFPMPDGSPGNYRFTSARSSVAIPGLGSDTFYSVTMRLNPGEGPASSGEVRLIANGTEQLRARLRPGWQTVEFRAEVGPARVFSAANLDIEILSPAEVVEGGEQRGVMLDAVSVTPLGARGVFSTSPLHEAGLILAAVLLYLIVARAGGLRPGPGVRRLALVALAPAIVAVAWALYAHRVEVAVALPHLLVTLVAGYLLLVIAARLLPRIFPAEARGALAVVAALLAAAWMLRFGWSALPQMQVIDLPYHLKWLKTLIGGDFLALYLPGSLSSVPPEWNLDVLIPKSPLFYVAMWPLGLLKGVGLSASVLFVVSLVDALVVLGVFALARPLGRSAGIWAAGVYALMPLAFRAFTYGILPTVFAQALTLAMMLTPVLRPSALRRPWPFVGWVLLLTASLIAFPTALAFNSAVLVFVALVWTARGSAPRGTALRLLAGLALALGLSVALYYGLYISSFITRTLPALTGGSGPGGKGWWFNGPSEMLGWTAGYLVSWLPYALVPVAVAWLWVGRREKGEAGSPRRLAALMAAWLLVLLGGMLLNLRFDLIGKHLYYTMPAASIAAGAVFGALWARSTARGMGRWLAILCTLSIGWAALAFLVTRL